APQSRDRRARRRASSGPGVLRRGARRVDRAAAHAPGGRGRAHAAQGASHARRVLHRGASDRRMNLSSLGAGFESPALASQQVFRAALEALARPGRIARVDASCEVPAQLEPAACALALALLDQDTSLWLSDALRAGQAGAYLRFHTGCRLAESAAD